jgi:hypothetical protein
MVRERAHGPAPRANLHREIGGCRNAAVRLAGGPSSGPLATLPPAGIATTPRPSAAASAPWTVATTAAWDHAGTGSPGRPQVLGT